MKMTSVCRAKKTRKFTIIPEALHFSICYRGTPVSGASERRYWSKLLKILERGVPNTGTHAIRI